VTLRLQSCAVAKLFLSLHQLIALMLKGFRYNSPEQAGKMSATKLHIMNTLSTSLSKAPGASLLHSCIVAQPHNYKTAYPHNYAAKYLLYIIMQLCGRVIAVFCNRITTQIQHCTIMYICNYTTAHLHNNTFKWPHNRTNTIPHTYAHLQLCNRAFTQSQNFKLQQIL